MNARIIPALALVAALAASQGAYLQAQQDPSAAAKATDPKAAALVGGFEDKLNLGGLDVTDTFTLVQKKDGRGRPGPARYRSTAGTRPIPSPSSSSIPTARRARATGAPSDDLYLYLPSTREFVYRNRKDDVGSTDVRADLFGKPNTLAQYWASLAGTAKVASWDCDVVRLDAKQLDVDFPVQKLYLRRSDGLPVKVESFSAGETLLRTSYYIEYKEIAKGKFIFTKLLAVDALEKDQKTYLTNEGISISRIADYTFSKAFLEEQSR